MAPRICRGTGCPYRPSSCPFRRVIAPPEGFDGPTYALCERNTNSRKGRK